MSPIFYLVLALGLLFLIAFLIIKLLEWLADHAVIIWRTIEPVYISAFIFACYKGVLENFFKKIGNFSDISFWCALVVCIAQFILSPRKAYIVGQHSRKETRYYRNEYYIDLSTGKFGNMGGGSSTITYYDYSLCGIVLFVTHR